jgi:NADH-quinone oxidoreductase subunit N
MYFDEPAERYDAMPIGVKLVLGLTSIFVILFGLVPGPLNSAAGAAARSLF